MLPHDVYDWDLQLSPVIANTGGRDVVVAGGKVGYVYEADAKSGDLLWKTQVGTHNGHDNDNLKAMNGDLGTLPNLPALVYPGALGGIETQLAVTDKTVYAAVVNLPTNFVDQHTPKLDFAKGKGDVVALDLASGKILWDTKLPAAPYGAMTVSNDLVFTTTFDGKLLAFDRSDGRQVWSYQLPTATNATVAIAGNTLLTAASVPHGGVKSEIIALQAGRAWQRRADHAGHDDDDRALHDDHVGRRADVGGRPPDLQPELRGLPHPGRGERDRERRAEPRPAPPGRGDGQAPGRERRRGDAGVQGAAERPADRRRLAIRRQERESERDLARRWRNAVTCRA